MGMRAKAFLRQIAAVVRGQQPWLRIRVSPRWAALLVAAGAQHAQLDATSPELATRQQTASPAAWFPTTTTALPRFDLRGPRVARSEDDASLPDDSWSDELLQIRRRAIRTDEVLVEVRTTTDLDDHKLLPVRITTEYSDEVYFILLRREQDLHLGWVGELQVHDARRWLDMSVAPLESLDSLGPSQTDVITRSVIASPTVAGRNAWRALIRSRPAGDPVAAAVLAGLA